MGKMVKRQVYYFDEPGDTNTQWVIEAVSRRLKAGGITKVIVASTSGKTAVEFARSIKGTAELVCVSESPYRREWGEQWPCLKREFRQKLEKLGVAIIDNAPYVFHSSVLDAARWSDVFPERLVKETLYSFGQGMKVAVEVALTAVSCGYVTPYEDVIGVGGSGKGADTAIVLRATYPASLFDKDPAKRLEIREIIAMPTAKKWWD
ncbi:MAG: pyruvate kinase alpha/beta domain-containing protein [Dehalococcoidia bacterium]